MAILGTGSGTGYPGAIDTATVEVDGASGTRARAAVPNDTNAAVLAMQAEYGTNPKGSCADVKTFLQVEHGLDGTHTNMGGLAMTVINIGDWNMDSTSNVAITHGLTFGNIRAVEVTIRNDANNAIYHSVGAFGPTPTNSPELHHYTVSSAVNLYRVTGGDYDNTSFDSTSYNRGWVTIFYVP